MSTSQTGSLSAAQRLLWAALLCPICLALLFLIRMPLSWSDQTTFSGLIILCCLVIGRFSDSRKTTSLLTLISVFCSLRYIVWRWSSSVSYLNHSGWKVELVGLVFALLLLSAETYSVVILVLGYFQSSRSLRRKPAVMPYDLSAWPSVDIYIPTYNEPLDVVRPTVLAAMSIDWPQDRTKVYILDDGRRDEFRQFAQECGCEYLIRSDNKHAKAGNINAALKRTSGEYIAIFDCDHIATRSFLQLTMGWFGKDEKLALVQTPHHFYSPDPFERNLNLFRKIPNEGALFYGVVQDGNDLWNATFFCGSCAVIKRSALEQIGGIAVETVTEDAHTALRLQRLGWNTAYIGIPQAAGLATGSLAAHVGQRIRWARGMVQILRTECPLFATGLNFAQRICYLNCVLHYLYAIPRLVFVSAPLIYLILGRSNLYGFIWEIMAYAAPHLVLSNMVNSRSQGDHRHSFWNEVYEMVLAPYILLPTTLALINPKWGKFNVTAKDSVVEESFFDASIARPYIFLLGLNVIGMALAIPRYFASGDPSGVLLVNVIWAALNSLMIGACIAVSFENKQRRSTTRVEASLTATLTLAGEPEQHCKVIDLSEGGLALRAETPFQSGAGQSGSVTIRSGSEQYRFAVEAVRTSESRVHLRFTAKDLKQQRDITNLIYARADSWIEWNKDQQRDRIFSSLLHVFSIGAHGIWILPSLLIKQESKQRKQGTKKLADATIALPIILCAAILALSGQAKSQSLGDSAAASDKPIVATAPTTTGPSSLANDLNGIAESPASSDANEIAVAPTVNKTPTKPTKSDSSELVFNDHQSLSDLGLRAALTLNSDHPKANINFILPVIKVVNSADLKVIFHADQFVPNESVDLVLTLNNVEVAALPVSGAGSGSEPAHVALPADLLVHDNALSFELRPQCATPCEKTDRKTSARLRIEPMTELSTAGFVLSLPNRLSALPAPFFDASLQRSTELPLVFEAQPDLATLKAAGVIASWYGSLAAHRGSHFPTVFGEFPKGNAVLIAHANSSLATDLGLDPNTPQVAICDNPADHYSKILAIIAPSSAALPGLASVVAQSRIHDTIDRITPDSTQVADALRVSNSKPTWSEAQKSIRFTNTLGNNLLHSRLGSPGKVYFRIAPDLDYGTALTVPFRLAFRLDGLSGDDHVWLSIRLNNTFVARRRLSIDDAGRAQTQSFAIPVPLIYSSNTLEVELLTNHTDAVVLEPQAVDLQILQATEIDLGNPTHFVQMPRLDLFAASGFPFTAKPDLADTTVVVPDYPTGAQIGLYLDAIGFLSAQTEVAASRFVLVKPQELRSGLSNNILVITGTNDDETYRPFQQRMVLLPTKGRFEVGDLTLPWQAWFSRAWFGRREEIGRLNQWMERESSIQFLMEQFVSPFRDDRSVLILATRSETDDHAYFDRLSKASREGVITGALSVADTEHFESFHLATQTYTLGSKLSVAAVYGWLRFHLWALPLALILMAGLFATWWEALLERQAERRLQVA